MTTSAAEKPGNVKKVYSKSLWLLYTGKNVVHQLTVSLEDLYNGATRKLAVQKNVICDKCEDKQKSISPIGIKKVTSAL
uniref:Uncharacterized protein n=1 Tax=Sinocyclocheilus rhinocerous TaxID=307959 RepID=A0A673JUS7_9TELE